MKTLLRCFSVTVLMVAIWVGFGSSLPNLTFTNSGNNFGAWAEEVSTDNLDKTNFINADNTKIDLNNSNINTFRQVPGMYPTLARIVVNNAPYETFDDVLKISGLSAAQIQRLKENAERFTLKKPDNSMNRERINNSLYRL
jgi:photosystem II PsbU protein